MAFLVLSGGLVGAPPALGGVFQGIVRRQSVGVPRANVVIDIFAIKRGVKCSDFSASANWTPVARLVGPFEIVPVAASGVSGCAIIAALVEFLRAGVFHPKIEVTETGALASKDTIVDTIRIAPSKLLAVIDLLHRALKDEEIGRLRRGENTLRIRADRSRMEEAEHVLSETEAALDRAAKAGAILGGPGQLLALLRSAMHDVRSGVDALMSAAANSRSHSTTTGAELTRADTDLTSTRHEETAMLRTLSALPH